MGVTGVVGLQWGDEGKGKIVDAVCENAAVAVRCQGGANAGHTVVVDGRKFILHLVPAGILREQTTCMIGNGVALDLEVLASEISELEGAGVKASGRLMVSRRAHVVLPLHKAIDEMEEGLRGTRKIGTTKRGIGPCYSDKCARFGIRVSDLVSGSDLVTKIQALVRAHHLGASGAPASDVDALLEYCRTHTPMLRELSGDVSEMLRDAISNGKEVVLEGSQGFLLDVDHGTYPFVTSCNTGVHGLACGAGIAPSSITRVLGVAKAYVTRVGEGSLPTEMEQPYQSLVRDKGQEFGATTGRPRRCGWMDLVALKYACELNGVTSLALTKLDTLSGLDALKTCVAYEYFGTIVTWFPPDTEFLGACVPRYVPSMTWDSLVGLKRLKDLSGGAAEYVKSIVEASGARLDLVSVGPGRDQMIRG